ncbi:MAG: FecR domain-containing protein [Pseudomonadota bacterium]
MSEDEKIADAAHRWRAVLQDEQYSKQDRSKFERWMAADPRHAAAFAEAEIFWKQLESVSFRATEDLSSEMQRARRRLSILPNSYRPFLFVTAAAFAAIGAFALSQIQTFAPASQNTIAQATPTEFETATGESQTYVLPDGTRLTLGALSAVEFAEMESERRAKLIAGSAYFEVVENKDRPFLVEIGGASVKVTGTSFNLDRRGDAVTVSVAEGSVRVSHPFVVEGAIFKSSSEEWRAQRGQMMQVVQLGAGDQVAVSKRAGLGKVESVRAEAIGAWRDGQLIYVRAPIGDVIADLNRYSATEIIASDDIRDIRISGTFAANEPETVLRALEEALPLEVQQDNQVWRVDARP